MDKLWVCTVGLLIIGTLQINSALALQTGWELQNCCPGLSPDIPSFCFNRNWPFNQGFTARCIENFVGISFTYYTSADRTGKPISRTVVPSTFDPKLTTTFITHGWMGMKDAGFDELITNTLDKVGGAAIFCDWSGASTNPNYFQAAVDLRAIAKELVILRTIWIKKYFMTREQFNCVGHSLGGQLCGLAGNELKFSKLTAMDPAGPDFENRAEGARISRNSADRVKCIHTTSSPKSFLLPLGMTQPCGHEDYYPNGGGTQPECQQDPASVQQLIGQGFTLNANIVNAFIGDPVGQCSHSTSIRLYNEALRNGKCAVSQICTDHTNLPGSCALASTTPLANIGSSANPTTGIFYLTTNMLSAYCKG